MTQLTYRLANRLDEDLYLNWANDDQVRENAFNSQKIDSKNHHLWFSKKIKENDSLMLVFMNENNVPVGQVRIDKREYLQVDISVDFKFRKKGYAAFMIVTAVNEYFCKFGTLHPIYSLIKIGNIASVKIFEKAGFRLVEENARLQYFKYIFNPKS